MERSSSRDLLSRCVCLETCFQFETLSFSCNSLQDSFITLKPTSRLLPSNSLQNYSTPPILTSRLLHSPLRHTSHGALPRLRHREDHRLLPDWHRNPRLRHSALPPRVVRTVCEELQNAVWLRSSQNGVDSSGVSFLPHSVRFSLLPQRPTQIELRERGLSRVLHVPLSVQVAPFSVPNP